MTVLVTGAAGLIGSRIAHRLAAQDEAVVAFDLNLQTGRLDDLIAEGRIMSMEGDIADPTALETPLSQHGIDRVGIETGGRS